MLRGLEEVNLDEELQINGRIRRHRRFRANYVNQDDEDNQRRNLREIELVREWLLRPRY